MCKHCYEKFISRTGRKMLICQLLENQEHTASDLSNLCLCQRYCNDKNQYIPYNQKSGCKNFE
nr:MAG TPA: hypothetical protein [Caudoviricetes sp.]